MKKVIVLVRPESAANIGAVCRVMANTGLSDLRIIGGKASYSGNEVARLALHAKNIWDNAKFFPPDIAGLKESCADCNILAGITRRQGAKRKTKGFTPEEFSHFLQNYGNGRAAVLFGNERTGLTDEELEICSLAVNIPSDDGFPSYNLSHAVLIIAYTLFLNASNTVADCVLPRKISFEEVCKTSSNIIGYLKKLGMFRAGGSRDNEIFFSEIISRAGMTKQEAEKFESLFKKIFHIKTL